MDDRVRWRVLKVSFDAEHEAPVCFYFNAELGDDPSETPVGVRREEPAPVRRVRDRLEAPRAVDDVAPREPTPELHFVLVVVAEGVADRRHDHLRSHFLCDYPR